MELSIIILSHNTKRLLLNCITSILSSIEDKFLYEIIVVDNASSDGSPSAINKLQLTTNNLKLIKNKENLGFAAGCNIGAKAARGKCVLFLNSDTEIEDKGLLLMSKFLEENPKVGILGGKLHNSDGSIQPSAGKFYNLLNASIMLLGFERLGFLRSSPNKIQKVDWVSGASMMIRKTTYEKLKGFDESFFMYIEDMELCFRAKKLGFDTYFYPNIKISHKSLGSSNRTFAIINIYKGILYFYKKHKTHFEYLVIKTLLILKAVILISIGLLTFNSNLRDRYKKAILNL